MLTSGELADVPRDTYEHYVSAHPLLSNSHATHGYIAAKDAPVEFRHKRHQAGGRDA